MNSRVGNHPCEIFPTNQDQSSRWKSSLPNISHKSGSISPTGIIPPRHFYQIRINFPAGNHPSQTFPVNQDQFTRRKSSLQKLFIKSGSISPTEIIPPRHFYQIRITPPPKMHPQPRFQANQDNFLTKSPVPNASPTASKSSRSNFSHQRMRHIIVTFKLYPPVKKQISRSVRSRDLFFATNL